MESRSGSFDAIQPSSSFQSREEKPKYQDIFLPDDWDLRVDNEKAMQRRSFHAGQEATTQAGSECGICKWDGTIYKLEAWLEDASIRIEKYPDIDALESSGARGCISCQIRFAACCSFSPGRFFNSTGVIQKDFDNTIFRPGYVSKSPDWTIFITADPALDVPRGFPRAATSDYSRDMSIEAQLRWAQETVTSCLDTHTDCLWKDGDEFLPTRLINVQPAGLANDLLLENSSTLPSGIRYVTLSYCWGTIEPQCMTTAQTLADRQKRIPWATLPKTFQDAVAVTRRLGFQYLWIDSVCIIQKGDDKKDWTAEAGRMFHVYKNSSVTLAAVWGEDSDSGLFQAPNTTQRQGPQQFATLHHRGHKWPLFMQRQHIDWLYRGLGIDASTRGPSIRQRAALFSRAWTFQECLISPRLLLFSGPEPVFECLSDKSCCCGAESVSWERMRLPMRIKFFTCTSGNDKDQADPQLREKRRMYLLDDTASTDSEWRNEVVESMWRDLVAEFGRMRIKEYSDRLAAIGAIAQQIQQVRVNEHYLAGLWSGSLCKDLLWMASPRGPAYEFVAKTQPQFPSWSWASRFPVVPSVSSGASDYPLLQFSDLLKGFESTVDIVTASCKYVDDNPFGILKESCLVLRGFLLPCFDWGSKEKPHTLFFDWSGLIHFWTENLLRGKFPINYHDCLLYLDQRLESWSPLHKNFLLLMGTEDLTAFFLVLRAHQRGEERTFSRLGVMELSMRYGSASHLPQRSQVNRKTKLQRFLEMYREHASVESCTIV